MRTKNRILSLIAIVLLMPTIAARAQSPADLAAEGQKLYDAGKFEEALARFEVARETLPPDKPELADRLDFNRACTMQALKQTDKAEKLLREVDARTGSPTLRSAARYNLGRIHADRAEELAKTDPAKAIDTFKTAERFFRNALAESPNDTDAARNIELVQRKRAELMKQQEQQQKQDQKNKQNQQNKDDQKQDQQDKKDQQDQQQSQDQKDQQKQGPDQSSSDQNKQQKSDQKQQDQKQQQQQQGEDQQNSPEQQQQNQSQQNDKSKQNKDQQSQPKPEEGKDEKQKDQKQSDERKDGRDQTAQQQQLADQADKDQKDQKNAREFDVQSAQILDKERQRREQIRKMFQQMMRARAAKVDKDW